MANGTHRSPRREWIKPLCYAMVKQCRLQHALFSINQSGHYDTHCRESVMTNQR